ncbi:alpha/beta fold hydrolase [Actinocatenispora thailandica]|uniref:alpha/beta fold hydrolase n=1 Tax=Actinocatenispora thailandica TaxID=227318 RepID=UPI001EF1B815|nr:alpha/beta fold hydrolase [Actinocatenispora thailandica]
MSLHIADTGGDTPALVFLHYWGGSTRTWDAVVDHMTARCVAIDHRGWGQSSAPETGYTTADLADDAQTVLLTLGLRDYVLVGHSMGGKVAQLLATRRPAGLRGVVLVAPAPAKPVAVPDEARAQMAAAYDSRESVLATLDAVLSHAPLTDAAREQVVVDSLAGTPAAKRAWPARTILEDVSTDLARIDVPVLVVAGEYDRVEPVELMRSHVTDLIPGARLDVIPDAGHLLPLERPDALAERIDTFRKDLPTWP